MDESKTLTEAIKDADTLADFWLGEVRDAGKYFKNWFKRSNDVESVYRGDNDKNLEKFNILWANTETMRPILYSRTPKPMIERRFKEEENSDVARVSSEVLERCVDYCIQIEGHELDSVMEKSVLDFLLSGRIISRIIYEPFLNKPEDTFRELTNEEKYIFETDGDKPVGYDDSVIRGDEEQYGMVREEGKETKDWEEAYIGYVFREDFLHSRGRSWEDVWWMAFGADLDKDELITQFGDAIAGKVRFTTPDEEKKAEKRKKSGESESTEQKTVRVWEIWNKRKLEVIFVAENNDFILRQENDPLNLETFFPTPRPVFSVFTNDSLIPVPEYTQYQYQAEELNILTRRISRLTRVLKASGVYNQDIKSIPQLLKGEENELIPDPDYGKLIAAKGLDGAIEWLPIANISDVISKLIALRQDTIQTIYEITGIADILRGASDPRETATAQRIKGQYGAMRIRKRQKEVQRYARDLIRLLAEVIAEQFDEDTLMTMSGIEKSKLESVGMEKVAELLRNDALRGFRIDIETDSTIVEDEEREKREVVEFMSASGQFINQAFQAVKAGIMSPQVAQEIMLYASRRFRAGRKLEGALQQIGQQPPKDEAGDSKKAELQAKMSIETAKLEQKDRQFMQELQIEAGKLKIKMQEVSDKKVIAELKVQAGLYEAMIDQETVRINAAGGAN